LLLVPIRAESESVAKPSLVLDIPYCLKLNPQIHSLMNSFEEQIFGIDCRIAQRFEEQRKN
jgi:hypothetical protein